MVNVKEILNLEVGRGYLIVQYFDYLEKDIEEISEELKSEEQFWIPLKNIMKRNEYAIECKKANL